MVCSTAAESRPARWLTVITQSERPGSSRSCKLARLCSSRYLDFFGTFRLSIKSKHSPIQSPRLHTEDVGSSAQIGEVKGFAGFLHVLLFAAKVRLGFVDPEVGSLRPFIPCCKQHELECPRNFTRHFDCAERHRHSQYSGRLSCKQASSLAGIRHAVRGKPLLTLSVRTLLRQGPSVGCQHRVC